MVLGKRRRNEVSCAESVTFKREKKPAISEALESDVSDESDVESSFDIETLSSASTPPTPQSGVASQSSKVSSRPLRYKCTYTGCDKAFSRPVRLEEHIRSHKNERIFKCAYDACDKTFLRQSHLNHHVKSAHTGERDYICDWKGCDKKFATGTRLKRHREAHEKKDRFRCTGYPRCDKTFRKHATLQRHINIEHLQLKPYLCKRINESTGERCAAAFDTAGGLRSHEAKCHDGKQYWCSICVPAGGDESTSDANSTGFITYAELQTHLKIQHPPECEYCGLVCSTAGELQRHIDLYHSGISLDDRRIFKCPEPDCGKGFTKQGNLKIHIRSTHEKKKPFVCGETDVSQTSGLQNWDGSNACKRGFTAKRSLEMHIRKFHLDGSPSHKPAKHEKRLTDQTSYKKTPSIATKLTGSGYVEESGRQLACPITACQHRFKRHADLRQHARVAHGLHEAETAEAVVESEALSGGPFWMGGVDDEMHNYDDYDDDYDYDEEDWREATGLDTPAVNIGAGHGFALPFAEPSARNAARSSTEDECHLAGVLASCLQDDLVDPALFRDA